MRKTLNALKSKTKHVLAVAAATGLTIPAAMAQTTGPFDAFFDAIALDGISAKVIAAGLLIVGIALAFKGPDVAKRVVRKV